MQTKFTTSINIVRDANRDLNYIPTPNAERVVQQIQADFEKGIRSFNIIGSYGTGKSAFLWALQQTFNGKKRYFSSSIIEGAKTDFIRVVGEYRSIVEVFAEALSIKKEKNLEEAILSELFNRYHDLGKRNRLLVILLDEFGKFLEYAAQHAPEKELYFLQQLAEFTNNPEQNILLLATVHQNFDAYAFSLNAVQRQEWSKVKGRFREITFNEPIEQLLFLAAEHLQQRSFMPHTAADIKRATKIFTRTKAFSINENYVEAIAERLYPLDLLTASVLTQALQKYGQNERSLFSFLESTDHTGINSLAWMNDNAFYNLACVYDYLVFNFYSFINSKYNPDFAPWSSIKGGLEEVERTFEKQIGAASKIIKTIGLLSIFGAKGSLFDRSFLTKYAKYILGIANAGDLIEELEQKKIILYRNHSKRFILFEGTDLDIQEALSKAEKDVTEKTIGKLSSSLKKEFQFPPLLAKATSFRLGTPRLFEYRISSEPINDIPMGEVDGFINLIFNESIDESYVKEQSANQEEAIIYGFYTSSQRIKELVIEIQRTQRVISENTADKVAIRELQNILLHQKNLLSHKILNNYTENSDVIWIYKGNAIKIESKKAFNQLLSTICEEVYHKAPHFNNELVNKHRISTSIHAAKRFYFRALTENWNVEDLGFEEDKFPPEKTIYLTLLKKNGIRLYSDDPNFVSTPDVDSSFKALWDASNVFLNSSKKVRRRLSDFVELLNRRPYKLKQGLIDFWIPTFLYIKRNDFALFGDDGYIPNLTSDILDLIAKTPGNYQIKAFDIEGVKLDLFNSYRVFLNQGTKEQLSNEVFIETIKPFIIFYRGLPDYAKHTKRLSEEAKAIRAAITKAKDPELTFFESFPQALGYTIEKLQTSKKDLEVYTIKLQDAIREIRTSYDELVNRFEAFIVSEFANNSETFLDYKAKLQERYASLKKHLLLPFQKTFIQRLDSGLDDRKAWLNSLAQAVVGSSLEKMNDEQEIILYDKLKSLVAELDSLKSISAEDVEEHEEVVGIEISSFSDGVHKKNIFLPKTKKQELNKTEQALKKYLSKDNSVNIAVLAGLLKELITK